MGTRTRHTAMTRHALLLACSMLACSNAVPMPTPSLSWEISKNVTVSTTAQDAESLSSESRPDVKAPSPNAQVTKSAMVATSNAQITKKQTAALFNSADANRDGVLSMMEFANAAKKHPELLKSASQRVPHTHRA